MGLWVPGMGPVAGFPRGGRRSGLSLLAAAPTSVFDPATLSLTGWWRASFAASPWAGTASAGGSGSQSLTEGTNPPSVGATVNGFAPADFDGTNDKLGTATTLDNFYTSTAYSGWALVNVDAISTNDATEFENDCIISSLPSAYWFIYLRSSGVVGIAHYGNDTNRYVVTTTFATGAWQLVQWKFESGVLKIRVNSGAWQTVAADALNTGGLSGSSLGVGVNTGSPQFLDAKMLELAKAASALSDATFNNIVSYCNSRYALSL